MYSHCRYSEIKERLTPFLRGCGYNPKKDLVFLPISGLLGHNIQTPVDKSMCPWYSVSSTDLCDDVLGRLQAAWCMVHAASGRSPGLRCSALCSTVQWSWRGLPGCAGWQAGNWQWYTDMGKQAVVDVQRCMHAVCA